MSDLLRTVIVDDEGPARRVARKLLHEYCPQVYVVAEAASAQQAIQQCQQLRPELVLLDVELKDGSGFDVLEHLDRSALQVVFVTAYDSYALAAIRAAATDYLVKPIDVDELTAAVERAHARRGMYTLRVGPQLRVAHGTQHHRLAQADILYVEADRSYSIVHMLGGKRIVASRKMGQVAQDLDPRSFFRTHRSYLVNIGHVRSYGVSRVELRGGIQLPISRSRAAAFRACMEN